MNRTIRWLTAATAALVAVVVVPPPTTAQDLVALSKDANQWVMTGRTYDLQRYSTHWVRKSFRDGLNPPAAKSTDLEVVEYVRRTAGGVDYVSSAPRDKDVMVVRKF